MKFLIDLKGYVIDLINSPLDGAFLYLLLQLFRSINQKFVLLPASTHFVDSINFSFSVESGS